jgi:hypothetical protein
MKKILLALPFLLISVYSFGQFSLGVKAGLNINNIAIKDEPSGMETDKKATMGFHVGVYTKLAISKKFSFIPELQFSQRGYKFPSIISSDSRVNMNYLELPLLLSYSPVEFLNIDLGSTIAYKISTVMKSDGMSRKMGDDFDEDLDIGITGGLRFNVSEKIAVIGRYYYGVSSLWELNFRDDANNPLGTVTAHNRNVQVGLSYKIK